MNTALRPTYSTSVSGSRACLRAGQIGDYLHDVDDRQHGKADERGQRHGRRAVRIVEPRLQRAFVAGRVTRAHRKPVAEGA
ncbi:MAG: hypothetical protein IPM16_12420 [Chloroflexi bacterium]|nr:hypothetical protein [Chloroflexota bacterium]